MSQIQNLRNFTVQIRNADNVIVGSGFVVSSTGEIVTCCHVVRDAGGQVAEGVEVNVYFPKARKQEQKAHTATVKACFLEHDDDVVVLQLDTTRLPDGIEPAILGIAESSAGHKFKSFGYRRLQNYQGLPAEGKIVDFAESPGDRILHSDPVMLSSQHIDSGMSGSAVLDIERNLVVGVIAETWDSGESEKDRDTSFAVDCRVLTFDPMCLQLADAAPTPQPTINSNPTGELPVSQPGIVLNLNNASAPLEEWVGRVDFLKTLNQDWLDPNCSIVELIGFGGEGKSSLTRRWLENLLQDSSLPQPTGVFWWGFYEKASVDEFFEAALRFLNDKIDPRLLTSTTLKVQVILAMLNSGRYLFILDGLEVLQQQEGDDYGELKSVDLREFLREFAARKHESFCLINSRAPLVDLIDFTTYTHRDVEQLTVDEGRELLKKLGVKGTDAQLNRVVQQWDGYALVLSLLGSYLVDNYGGDIEHIVEIPAPTAEEPRYDRVRRVLRRYDENLTAAEQELMRGLSAFRLPIPELALQQVFPQFEAGVSASTPSQQTQPLNSESLLMMVQRLVNYRILRHNQQENYYTIHPLIRAHYLEILHNEREEAEVVHQRIAECYLDTAGETPENPTLDDLAPFIEAVHHLCQAGNYDEADLICRKHIYQGDNGLLTKKLGAWETYLTLMLGFFPNGDTSQEPKVSYPDRKSVILNAVGLCLTFLGRMEEAPIFYERHNAIALSRENWEYASIGYQNLTRLYAYLGKLTDSADAAREALNLAHRAESNREKCDSLVDQGWVAYLQGDSETAGVIFQQAEALQREIDSTEHLYSIWGIRHADYLLRVGNRDYARQVIEANLEICQRNNWLRDISSCHRVLGNLDADGGQNENAREHYNKALKIACSISDRPVLIEALLARGRWAARRGEVAAARSDLEEALNYACAGSYRIYEADIRVALAWMHLANHNYPAAKAEAEKALLMSEEMGYHWGRVDAGEVLQTLEQKL
ncbi:MAG TPA: trypsin-like peptidase domain-containing protein [Leptolyngbyaceae cyanobacterium]